MKKILEMKDIFINGFSEVDKIEFIKYSRKYKLNNNIDLEKINELIQDNLDNLEKLNN